MRPVKRPTIGFGTFLHYIKRQWNATFVPGVRRSAGPLLRGIDRAGARGDGPQTVLRDTFVLCIGMRHPHTGPTARLRPVAAATGGPRRIQHLTCAAFHLRKN